jgi:hypothetical protein
MAKREKLYRRLPGRARHWMGSTTLWLGPDHLLVVEARGYTESYRRFYYRDIGSIVTRGTGVAKVWNLILGLLVLGIGIAAAATAAENRITWAIPGVSLLLLLLINVVRGASCVSQITTRVQTAPLPLRRRRAARRALSLLRERVLEAQRPLTAPAANDLAGMGQPPS